MADILGLHVNSYTSPSGATYAEVDQYNVYPNPLTHATHVVMRIHVHTGTGTSLGAGGAERARNFSGSINGQTTGEWVIKTASQVWAANSDYYTTIEFDIAYAPGVLACTTFRIFRVSDGSISATSTFAWPAGYTVNSGTAVMPTPVRNLLFNGVLNQTVGNYEAGTLSWDAPTSSGTTGIIKYDMYYASSINGLWHYIGTTTATSASVHPGWAHNTRGQTAYFIVYAFNMYGSSGIPDTLPEIVLSLPPTEPTYSDVPSVQMLSAGMHIEWHGAVDAASYEVYYRVNGGEFIPVDYTKTLNYYDIPAGYLINTMGLQPAQTLQFKIQSRNAYGVMSYNAHYTQYITLVAGRMSVKIGGLWYTGRTFVKVAGVWRQAMVVYTKVNGTWRANV